MATRFQLVVLLMLIVVSIVEGRSRLLVKEFEFGKQPRYKEFIDIPITHCVEVRKLGGNTESGVYTIWLDGKQKMEVHCQFEDRISYVSIMSQKFGQISFQQNWAAYENGFGHPASGDFWQGLNAIYNLNKYGYNYMNITLQDWTYTIASVGYTFHMNDANDKFRAYFSNYYSPNFVPDDLSSNSGMPFSTHDRPDPNLCAVQMMAGWWYNYCAFALPTGKRYPHPNYTPSGKYYDGLFYTGWKGYGYDYSMLYIKIDLGKY